MKSQTMRLVQWILLIGGLFYTLVGLAQLFAPLWFYTHIGLYPPFNRHYMGDLGSFTLPIGIALMLAARDPLQQRLLVGAVAGGSVLHSLNHLYDDLFSAAPDPVSTLTLVIFGIVLAWTLTARFPVQSRQAA